MGRDTKLRDDEGIEYSFDLLSTQKWLEGHQAGAETVVRWLLERAQTLFAQDKDEQAVELKKLAKEVRSDLIPKMRHAADQHAANYPYAAKASS